MQENIKLYHKKIQNEKERIGSYQSLSTSSSSSSLQDEMDRSLHYTSTPSPNSSTPLTIKSDLDYHLIPKLKESNEYSHNHQYYQHIQIQECCITEQIKRYRSNDIEIDINDKIYDDTQIQQQQQQHKIQKLSHCYDYNNYNNYSSNHPPHTKRSSSEDWYELLNNLTTNINHNEENINNIPHNNIMNETKNYHENTNFSVTLLSGEELKDIVWLNDEILKEE